MIPELDIDEALWLVIDGFGSRSSDARRDRFGRLLDAIEDRCWKDLYGYTPGDAISLFVTTHMSPPCSVEVGAP